MEPGWGAGHPPAGLLVEVAAVPDLLDQLRERRDAARAAQDAVLTRAAEESRDLTPDELADLDRRHLWHPFTQQQGWMEEDFPIIESADDTTLYDTEGNAYIDGVSSLWCNVHGHRHPAIDIAIKDQLDRVAHSTMLGLSHAPAAKLAKRLVDLAPDGLNRVFFSDNGSTACEIALKMAYQWHHQRGEWWRAGFVCLRNSYHGDTLGSVSVGGIELFHSLYRPLLFDAWQAERYRRGEEDHGACLVERREAVQMDQRERGLPRNEDELTALLERDGSGAVDQVRHRACGERSIVGERPFGPRGGVLTRSLCRSGIPWTWRPTASPRGWRCSVRCGS